MAQLFSKYMNYSFGLTTQVLKFADLDGYLGIAKILYGMTIAFTTISILLDIVFMFKAINGYENESQRRSLNNILSTSVRCTIAGFIFTVWLIFYTDQIPKTLDNVCAAILCFILAVVWGRGRY